MSSSRRPVRAMTALAVASLATATLLPPAATAAGPLPSLRVFAVSDSVTLYLSKGKVPLALGTWLAPVGGDFRIDVTRPDYVTAVSGRQIDTATGLAVRDIPSDLLNGWKGFKGFFNVAFRRPDGTNAFRRTFDFCPNSWDRARLDDLGREQPFYPYGCSSYSRLARGMVWGIEDHWAVRAVGSDWGPRVAIPEGRYTATVRVAPAFARLFRIQQSSVTLDVTVTEAPKGAGGASAGPANTAGAGVASPAVPDVSDPDPSTLPDLASFPAWAITVRRQGNLDLLAFASTVWNAGPRAVHVEGFRREGEAVMDAYQYFHDANGDTVGRAPVGTLAFDTRDGHRHWHFTQFAEYSLVNAGSGAVVRSRKQSFCLFPTDGIDLTVPGAEFRPWSFDSFSVCGGPSSIWIREDLDAGWGDTYYQWMAGQAFDITNVPNGSYFVKVHANPQGMLFDANRENDFELRAVTLSGTPGARKVAVAPWQGLTN